MSDLIFVSTKQFEELVQRNVGVHLKDQNDAEMIIINGCRILINNTKENVERGDNI